MVTVRTRKLGTCRLGKPHWNAGRRQTHVGTERWFLEGQSSPRSNAYRFEPRTPERWHSRGQVFIYVHQHVQHWVPQKWGQDLFIYWPSFWVLMIFRNNTEIQNLLKFAIYATWSYLNMVEKIYIPFDRRYLTAVVERTPTCPTASSLQWIIRPGPIAASQVPLAHYLRVCIAVLILLTCRKCVA